MKYKTARQAWHDAYYNGKENTLIEFLQLGSVIQKTVKVIASMLQFMLGLLVAFKMLFANYQ